jgi:S1-C subfamily serine protease
LFTDVALIGGDSGGPLFTLDGKLVGIHSRIGTEISENMHVPVDVFRDSWDRMVDKQAWGVLPGFDPPYIGVTSLEGASGPAVIRTVEEDSPADVGGLKKDDLVIRVDDKPVSTFQDLVNIIGESTPGDLITVVVRRENTVMRFPVIVGTKKPSRSK